MASFYGSGVSHYAQQVKVGAHSPANCFAVILAFHMTVEGLELERAPAVMDDLLVGDRKCIGDKEHFVLKSQYNSAVALAPSEVATVVVAIAAVFEDKYLVADGVSMAGWNEGPEKQGGPSLYQKAVHRAGSKYTAKVSRPRTLRDMHWSRTQAQEKVSFRKGAAGALVHWFTNRAKFDTSPPSLVGPFGFPRNSNIPEQSVMA
ncbi:predicted protein [Histoplasma mississippiense (nom. inval.)]|uniref:predicted protein n=1 Tax=Ajellomyces capsulatus (strain NAm1 / WU24) TaxID=2059318 RepID=UPI000157D4C8|nr:predicted protein [Histoplasma mississippiense (nom. inval.)]EDN05250.1 predicted protein [Histoplasma mississippiense (nom. inval.)]